MLHDIIQVARDTPGVLHWLPTQERGILDEYLRGGGNIPGNLTIRVSSPVVGIVARPFARQGVRASLVVTPGSVPDGAQACPAPRQGNRCLDCRACWRSENPIAYTAH